MQRSLLLLILTLAAISCKPLLITGEKASNTILNYKIKEAFRALDGQPAIDYAFYETNGTYIEEGLRYNYGILKNIASVSILEKAIGEKIFLSGPHQEELNYYSSNSFGYYNPDFWAKVNTVVEYSLKSDGIFKQLGKYVYDQHLQKEVELYHDSYLYLKANKAFTEQLMKDYQKAMQDGDSAGAFIQESFRAYADTKEQLGEDWYVANTAPGFWIRRMIDGTAEQIFDLVKQVKENYD